MLLLFLLAIVCGAEHSDFSVRVGDHSRVRVGFSWGVRLVGREDLYGGLSEVDDLSFEGDLRRLLRELSEVHFVLIREVVENIHRFLCGFPALFAAED